MNGRLNEYIRLNGWEKKPSQFMQNIISPSTIHRRISLNVLTSISVIPKEPVHKCNQINIKLVLIAEVAQVFLPVRSADFCTDCILSPIAHQELSVWERALC